MTMLVIGSRGSPLALWQSRWVASQLATQGIETRIEIIKTTGDKITDVALSKVGAKGLFTKELEDALLAGQIDLAVHSLKDMPTALPTGLMLAAIPEREDPRDVLVGSTLDGLAQGARVGTSSLRREAQLRARRPDLIVEPVRGNLDTRLRKVEEGRYDAIVLAAAGLRRLGLESRITELLSFEIMCPAVGQGALAIETREDSKIGPLLNHAPTRAAVTAERALLAGLGGGCQVPIGAHARIHDATLHLLAVAASPDGSTVILRAASGPVTDAVAIGEQLARELLDAGAREILDAVYGAP
ncbi:MAG: hydroxymethylbilane synthase [Acidobacteriia bacterium]|nr:hydroxymethylbilane synthase [Terriglobia bacterium]